MSPQPQPPPPDTQEPSGHHVSGSGSGCNADRLLPRGHQRKRASDVCDAGRERKKLKEGLEEMEKLRVLVPTLRESEGRLSQVDIIEETISYIDTLHRRLADRMMTGVASSHPVLTLDHVEEAERSSQDLAASEEQFGERLAALSQSGGSVTSNDANNNDDSDNTNQNSREEPSELCKPSQATSSDSEG